MRTGDIKSDGFNLKMLVHEVSYEIDYYRAALDAGADPVEVSEAACLSCQSVLVRRGAVDLSSGE